MLNVEAYGDDSALTGELLRGLCIEQPFVATARVLKAISIPFATYRRTNNCTVSLVLQEEDETPIATRNVKGATVKDNRLHTFDFSGVYLERGKRYLLKLYSDAAPANGITAKYGPARHKDTYVVIRKSKSRNKELSFLMEYELEKEQEEELDAFEHQSDTWDLPPVDESKVSEEAFRPKLWKDDEPSPMDDLPGGRGVIYTVIVNHYDYLVDPVVVTPGIDYICFTDSKRVRSNIWQLRPLSVQNDDPARSSRLPKLLPHRYLPEYDYSLYVDGNITMKKDLRAFFFLFLCKSDMVMVRHRDRKTAYEEYRTCLLMGKDDPTVMMKQIREYQQEGYPADNGLIHGAVILRRHHVSRVSEAMEQWWQEVATKSRRDQLSYNYIMWKRQEEITYMEQKMFKMFFDWQGKHAGEKRC